MGLEPALSTIVRSRRDLTYNYAGRRVAHHLGNVEKPYWPSNPPPASVMPAKAGIHRSLIHMDSRLRGNDMCSL
jgi:hypothetical protein